MSNVKSIFLFSSMIALIYLLRSYQNPSTSSSPRFLAALKTKFCADVTDSSQPTSSDKANAADFRSQFFELMRNNENHLKSAIKTSDWVSYVKTLIYPTIVWLIFLAFSIIGWIAYCCCCCCDKVCPPCQSCRRDVEKNPYKGFELWGLVLFLVVFGTGIIGISVAGILYSTQVQSGTQNTVCTLVTIYDETVYGTTYNSTKWLGIYSANDKIKSILYELNLIPAKFSSSFSDISWIDSGINNLLMANRNIYTKYKNSYLSSPNPTYPSDLVPSLFTQKVRVFSNFF